MWCINWTERICLLKIQCILINYGFNPSLEMVTVASSPRPENNSMEVETETQYLKIAKKGGGHKGTWTY